MRITERGSGLEADSPLGRRIRRWGEKRADFLIEIAQGGIMKEEGVINLREPFLHGVVRGKRFAHLHKRANDKHAHLHGVGTIQNIGSLESAVAR